MKYLNFRTAFDGEVQGWTVYLVTKNRLVREAVVIYFCPHNILMSKLSDDSSKSLLVVDLSVGFDLLHKIL